MRWAPAIVIGLLLALPASSVAATVTEVTMLSEKNDYIGQAKPNVLAYDGTSVQARGNASDLILDLTQTGGTPWTVEFAAPKNGSVLKPGVYDNAVRVISQDATHPGIDIGGDGRGCNMIRGRFEVKDVAFDSAGVVQRAWIVFEQHCEGQPPALFGDVRYNEPATDGAPIAAPAIQRWPEDDVGHPDDPQPVTFIAPPGGMTIKGVAVGGADASDFTTSGDTCTGKTIAGGARCQVMVNFAPPVAGTRTATLTATDSAGNSTVVPLQGWDHGGHTALSMQSDSGDYIGNGQNWSYTPANVQFSAGGTNKAVEVATSTWDDWTLDFAPAPNGTLVPGRYAPVKRFPFNDQNPGLDVSGIGRGCNELSGEFTVTEATFDSEGQVKTFAASFIQHCENAAPALTGTVAYRQGDNTPPAPWMAPAPAPPPAPGAPGSPPANPPAAPPSTDPCSAAAFAKSKVRTGTKRSNRIRGSKRSEVIRAGAGNDFVRAGGGSDCVDGGAGRDRLDGGAGNDVLIGGPGRDVLICGSGRDMAIIGRGDRTRGCEVKVRVKR